ncbi:MAG: hypothetical protein IPG95_11155 [Saprospiraceae bacterium]|nr:hypothetical protein [Saprospiraceae bacterium]
MSFLNDFKINGMSINTNIIMKQLIDQPYEEVYSKYFAGKEINNETWDQFFDSFCNDELMISEFGKMKINYLVEFVLRKNQNDGYIFFPTFVKFYIHTFYKNNGLRNTIPWRKLLENEQKIISLSSFNKYFQDYESEIIGKHWITDIDKFEWKQLQEKREAVLDFENYLYDLEYELDGTWNEGNEGFLEKYKEIYNEHIVRLRIEIAEIKLFRKDVNKIQVLENLIDYFTGLKDDYSNFNIFIKDASNSMNSEEYDIPINIQDQEKFIYCSKLGVIDFLKKKIEDSGVKYTDSKLYPLIVQITGNKLLSVKKLMSYHKKPHHDDLGNPFNNLDLMNRVDKYLFNNRLVKSGD